MKYTRHEISACYRDLSTEELAELKASIQEDGLLHPIVLFEEKVLDGWQRALACESLGKEPDITKPEIKDPYRYAAAVNDRRRHASVEERAITVGKLANLPRGTNQYRKKVDASQEATANCMMPTQGELRKMHNISKSSAERGVRVVKKGIPELAEAVVKREINLTKASEEIASLPKDQQAEALVKAKTEPKSKRQPTVFSNLQQSGFKKIKMATGNGLLSPDVSELEHADRRKIDIDVSHHHVHKERYENWLTYRKRKVRDKVLAILAKAFPENLDRGFELLQADLARYFEVQKQTNSYESAISSSTETDTV